MGIKSLLRFMTEVQNCEDVPEEMLLHQMEQCMTRYKTIKTLSECNLHQPTLDPS